MPFFKDVAVGCYVRVGIGAHEGRMVYRVGHSRMLGHDTHTHTHTHTHLATYIHLYHSMYSIYIYIHTPFHRQVCEITDIIETPKVYSLGPTKTNKCLKLR